MTTEAEPGDKPDANGLTKEDKVIAQIFDTWLTANGKTASKETAREFNLAFQSGRDFDKIAEVIAQGISRQEAEEAAKLLTQGVNAPKSEKFLAAEQAMTNDARKTWLQTIGVYGTDGNIAASYMKGEALKN